MEAVMTAVRRKSLGDTAQEPIEPLDISKQDASRLALAHTRIEGGFVSNDTTCALSLWATGGMSDEELIEDGLRKFGPGS
jgi:hypothetical protein